MYKVSSNVHEEQFAKEMGGQHGNHKSVYEYKMKETIVLRCMEPKHLDKAVIRVWHLIKLSMFKNSILFYIKVKTTIRLANRSHIAILLSCIRGVLRTAFLLGRIAYRRLPTRVLFSQSQHLNSRLDFVNRERNGK